MHVWVDCLIFEVFSSHSVDYTVYLCCIFVLRNTGSIYAKMTRQLGNFSDVRCYIVNLNGEFGRYHDVKVTTEYSHIAKLTGCKKLLFHTMQIGIVQRRTWRWVIFRMLFDGQIVNFYWNVFNAGLQTVFNMLKRTS